MSLSKAMSNIWIGQQISAYTKNNNPIEGRLLRHNGKKIILFENGKWIPYEGLTHIKCVGKSLRENAMNAISTLLPADKYKYDQIVKDSNYNKIVDAFSSQIEALDKDAKNNHDETRGLIDAEIKTHAAQKEVDSGQVDKTKEAQKVTDEFINSDDNDGNKSQEKQLHEYMIKKRAEISAKVKQLRETGSIDVKQEFEPESLSDTAKEFLFKRGYNKSYLEEDMTTDEIIGEAYSLGMPMKESTLTINNVDEDDLLFDDIDSEDHFEEEEDIELDDEYEDIDDSVSDEEAKQYVDEEFGHGLAPEKANQAYSEAVEKFNSGDSFETIVNYIQENYECSPDEAADIVEAAMYEDIDKNESTESAIEDAIDEFEEEETDGEDVDLFEHICRKLNIEDGPDVLHENKGNVPDAILALAESIQTQKRKEFYVQSKQYRMDKIEESKVSDEDKAGAILALFEDEKTSALIQKRADIKSLAECFDNNQDLIQDACESLL